MFRKKRKSEIEVLIARRVGRASEVSRVRAVPAIVSAPLRLAPGQAEEIDSKTCSPSEDGSASASGPDELAPGQVDSTIGDSGTLENDFLQVTIARETYEKLQYALDLLSHVLPNREIAPTLDRALDLLVETLERRKFGARVRSRRTVVADNKCARQESPAHTGITSPVVTREASERTQDLLAGLRRLGYRLREAKGAAEYCEKLGDLSLEESLRAAIGYLAGPSVTVRPPGGFV